MKVRTSVKAGGNTQGEAMKLKRIFLLAALLFVFPTVASAMPDFSWYVEYFDANGQQIGWRLWGCTGTYGSGPLDTDYTTVEIGVSCYTGDPVEVTCADLDMLDTGCGICMSYDYEALYLEEIAPDPCE
jgi:hypothetical protein